MITREQFENSYIINDHGELRNQYKQAAMKFGYRVGVGHNEEVLFVSENTTLQQWSTLRGFCNSRHFRSVQPKLLELADFNKALPQYKYTPLEVESVFDLKEMFEKGEIYFRWCGNEEEGSGGVGYDKITTENMLICRYEEGRLLKREEVKWQDEVEEFLLKCIDSAGVFDIGYGNGNANSMSDEAFLEMCRVALRATGELK